MTQKRISRRAFERAARSRFELSAGQARELRRLFEKHTEEIASKRGLAAHPRIVASKVSPAKAAATRKARAKKAAVSGARVVRGAPREREVPQEFLEAEDMMFGGEETAEEVDY